MSPAPDRTGAGPLAVVLAAGGGSRFTGSTHKLVARLRGRAVVAWAVAAPVAAGLPVLVVAGAVDLDGAFDDAFDALGDGGGGIEVIQNPDWAEGQATSLAAAVGVARARGHDSIVVGLGDQPLLTPAAWAAVATTDDGPIAVATYRGVRGQPVRLGAEVWPDLPVTGDEGARRLLSDGHHPVTEVACDGDPADIDTQEDLRRWS